LKIGRRAVNSFRSISCSAYRKKVFCGVGCAESEWPLSQSHAGQTRNTMAATSSSSPAREPENRRRLCRVARSCICVRRRWGIFLIDQMKLVASNVFQAVVQGTAGRTD
jgi:hypothetical protein